MSSAGVLTLVRVGVILEVEVRAVTEKWEGFRDGLVVAQYPSRLAADAALRRREVDYVGPANQGLRCLDGPEGCSGPVEHRTTPDRDDFKAFPRCEAHFERRLKEAERNRELLSDVAPSWFDPMYVGERWDEDDY